MTKLRQRKLTFALLALILIFAGCKAESPTSPTVTTPGGTPSGGTTPPTNANLALTVSNATPTVSGNTTVTATVTVNNQAVPNGTAVQFLTNLGTFTDTGLPSEVKTTTNGAAAVTLTSAVPGPATVTATVNNVSKQVLVTFGAATTPTPGGTTPTLASITPNTGKPQGGDTVTLTGTNFAGPIRVLFKFAGGTTKDAFVASFSKTQIIAVTPPANVPLGSTLSADVQVITQAGTAGETPTTPLTAGFTYTSANLTPVINALQPTSGPISGGTRVTIIGSAFQQPVQVFFGAAEAQVISVTFNQIIVMSPRASDTAPTGSGVVVGPVDVKVRNVNSGTDVTFSGGFRYTPKMQITTVRPTEGPFSGGTQMTIDGTGFDDPLAVSVANVAAQVIRVSGTEIVVVTSGVQPTGCGDITGDIVVTNTENGDSATGPQFIYRVPKPLITGITPNPAAAGGTTNITVLNAIGFPRITIGGLVANVTGTTVNPDGTTTFAVQIPPTLQLNSLSCPAGGSAPAPTGFDVQYTSATTGCTDTAPKGLTVNPAAAPVLFTNPLTFNTFTDTITQAPAPAPPFPGTSVTPSSQTMQLVNNGTAPLDITSVATAGAGCANFVFGPAIPPTITLNECEAIPITVTYLGQTSPATQTCTLTVTTTGGTRNFLLVGISQ